ncbi:MAG: LysR family transcriptional regulator [Lachnospiraceae bacterium]|nr:LysR family transcriptional regulator [Lachnospiraceae bacterium]
MCFMLETKQLKYFAVAAECSSFSEAALVLYTTQSNVSKVISLLEDQLGFTLFARDKNGVTLTSRGEEFYRRTAALLENLEELETEAAKSRRNGVKIAASPSSWFARQFSDFYELHKEENTCWNIHTGTLEEIVTRIRKMEDELAFLYIFPEQQPRFAYEQKRYQLCFETFGVVDGMLYFAPEDRIPDRMPSLSEARKMKLIQAENDEYAVLKDWICEGQALFEEPPVPAVTTNSDYIMNIMMKRNGLANISAECFSSYEEGHRPGYSLTRESGQIRYGILWNPGNPPQNAAKKLADHIRKLVADIGRSFPQEEKEQDEKRS